MTTKEQSLERLIERVKAGKPNACEAGGVHVPATPENIIDALSGRVYCAKCGLYGHRSHGRRKDGRPARIFWLTDGPRHALSSLKDNSK